MSELTLSDASVVSETATAPAPQPAPASAPETPAGVAPSRDSRNLDAKADYLSRIQSAASAPTDPAEAAVAEATAKAAAEAATDAPVSGESEQEQPATQEGEPQSQSEEQTRAPIIPYEQLPENMRGELRRANLAPDVKEALAQAWYERKAFHETGFTVDHARQLKTFGFTPEAAVERIKLHPTAADAQMDAQLADIARNLIADYQGNPQNMIEGLRTQAPESFDGFAKAFASNLRQAAPEAYGGVASEVMWNAMSIMERELPEDALDEREHVAYVKAKLFPAQSQQAGPTSAFNPNDPIHKKYQEIVQSQVQQRQAMAGQFETALYQYGEQAVRAEVVERFKAAAPAGLDEEFVNRAVNDIVDMVKRDVIQNKNVRDQVTRFMSGNLSQEELNAAVAFVTDRARPLIAIHLKPQVDFWSKAAKPQTPTTPGIQPKPALKPAPVQPSASTRSIPGSAPAPSSPTTPPQDFIKAGRAKGWDNFKLMNEWTRGQTR